MNIIFRLYNGVEFEIKKDTLKKDIKIVEILEMAKNMGVSKVLFKY